MQKKSGILLFFLVFSILTRAQNTQNVLDIRIMFRADSIAKSDLLDTLSLKYNLHFSYNPVLIEASSKVQIHAKNKPLHTILNQITNRQTFNYKTFDRQIIFFPVHQTVSDTTQYYTIIKGTVFNKTQSQTIPYCNISVVGQSMGTMSNSEGNFSIKIPKKLWTDTLAFSSLGYDIAYYPIAQLPDTALNVLLYQKSYKLQQVDVIRYNPENLLMKMYESLSDNYDNEYALVTGFYRETTLENSIYTDISEAVIQIMKAPYSRTNAPDNVKYIKGRKGTESKPQTDIRFRLMGGPFYITKLDIVKNTESFINPEFRSLYSFEFDEITTIDNRQTAVLLFKPVQNLRDILYTGKLYIDIKTYAIARAEFALTKQGLKAARSSLIHKVPKKTRAIPTQLEYVVQYKQIDGKWYLLAARSSFKLKINNRKNRERTRFHSIAELAATKIEKGDIKRFSRKETFKSNEIFTDKIVSYDEQFWQNYNIIEPEEKLNDALINFDNRNLFITYRN